MLSTDRWDKAHQARLYSAGPVQIYGSTVVSSLALTAGHGIRAEYYIELEGPRRVLQDPVTLKWGVQAPTLLLKRAAWNVFFVRVSGISVALVSKSWLRMTPQEALHLFGKISQGLCKPSVRQ